MTKYDLDVDYSLPEIDISKDDPNEIIAEADKIIRKRGTNPEKLAVAYLKKGQCLYKLAHADVSLDKKKLYKARAHLEKALELSPNMPEALMRLGTINCEISEYERSYYEGAVNKLETEINSSVELSVEEREKLEWEEFERELNRQRGNPELLAFAARLSVNLIDPNNWPEGGL